MLDQLRTGPALIDQVHDQLVSAIASGDLAPGQRLTQESVAEMLGVSRQPVSHALQVLKRRGLLIEHGKRGLAVAPLERDRILALYQIREALDGLAARLAAERCRDGSADPRQIEDLKVALREGLELITKEDIKALVLADVNFHTALYALSGNDEIQRTVAEQWPQFMRSIGFVLNSTGRTKRVWAEHREIVEAVVSGDPAGAESKAQAHSHNAARDAARELPEMRAA